MASSRKRLSSGQSGEAADPFRRARRTACSRSRGSEAARPAQATGRACTESFEMSPATLTASRRTDKGPSRDNSGMRGRLQRPSATRESPSQGTAPAQRPRGAGAGPHGTTPGGHARRRRNRRRSKPSAKARWPAIPTARGTARSPREAGGAKRRTRGAKGANARNDCPAVVRRRKRSSNSATASEGAAAAPTPAYANIRATIGARDMDSQLWTRVVEPPAISLVGG